MDSHSISWNSILCLTSRTTVVRGMRQSISLKDRSYSAIFTVRCGVLSHVQFKFEFEYYKAPQRKVLTHLYRTLLCKLHNLKPDIKIVFHAVSMLHISWLIHAKCSMGYQTLWHYVYYYPLSSAHRNTWWCHCTESNIFNKFDDPNFIFLFKLYTMKGSMYGVHKWPFAQA